MKPSILLALGLGSSPIAISGTAGDSGKTALGGAVGAGAGGVVGGNLSA